jgi:hypothetical protein
MQCYLSCSRIEEEPQAITYVSHFGSISGIAALRDVRLFLKVVEAVRSESRHLER